MRTEPFNESLMQGYAQSALLSIGCNYWTPEIMKFVSESIDIAAYLDSILEGAKEVDADE